MLKLSLKPGEYLMLGDNIKVIFSGGSANNIHLVIDAPKEVAIARNAAAAKNGASGKSYYKERGISKEAQQKIVEILRQEREKGNNAD